MNKTELVTGDSGYIGSVVTKDCLRAAKTLPCSTILSVGID